MIIDLDEKTVTFAKPQVLTLGQLWSLIELLDPDADENLPTKLTEKVHSVNLPRWIYTVESDTRDTLYCVVHFENGDWACSCPDWTFRRSQEDTYCKHISRIMHPRGWMV